MLTACLIVRDEAHRLHDCLQSVSHFVDEIVVVDTGSSDDTIAVARADGARVHETRWTEDFAAARNTALSLCSTPWILSIDADEIASGEPELVRELLTWSLDHVDAFGVQIDQQGEFTPLSITQHLESKLFRRDYCHWWGRVHEQIVVTRRLHPGEEGNVMGRPVLHVEPLPASMLTLTHSGYADVAEFVRKCRRYADLARIEVSDLEEAHAPAIEITSSLLKLGRSQLGIPGQLDDGLATLATVRDRSTEGDPFWRMATTLIDKHPTTE